MNRKALANTIGLLSIVSSSALWIEIALGKALRHVPAWIDIGLNGWLAGWVIGLLLAIVATTLWPRRWALVLLFPVLSFLSALALVSWSHVEW
jgi:hypothetical protein